jgi:4-amino-4-deoxy-L-arabinose transferase-like glycosyltransferase
MNSKSLLYVLLLAAVCGFVSFYRLGDRSLWDPDEPRYAHAAKEMLNSHNWITPYFNYEERLDKPVFFYWLVASAYVAFGVNEFAARFWPALLGCATVIVTYFFGRKVYDEKTGLLSGLILCTSLAYLITSQACITDMALTFFITLSLACFYHACTDNRGRVRFLNILAASAAMGLATLTKGPVGVILPMAVMCLYLLISRVSNVPAKMHVIAGIAIFFAVTFPWYWVMWRIHGAEFVNYFILQNNFGRFLNIGYHRGPVYYYIPVIILGLFPWTAYLPCSLWSFFRARSTFHFKFLLLWIMTVLIFFSLSKTKLPTYVLPLYPPLALIVGKFWADASTEDGRIYKKATVVSSAILGFLALLMIFGLPLALQHKYPHQATGFLPLSILSSLILLPCGAVKCLRKYATFFYRIVIFNVVYLAIIKTMAIPAIDPYRSANSLALKAGSLPLHAKLVTYDFFKPSVVYYFDRKVTEIDTENELIQILGAKEEVFCIIKLKQYNQMVEKLRPLSTVVAADQQYVLVSNGRGY